MKPAATMKTILILCFALVSLRCQVYGLSLPITEPPEEPKTPTPPAGCIYQGNFYGLGADVGNDPCLPCRCEVNGVQCYPTPCAAPMCDNYVIQNCCPYCPEPDPPAPPSPPTTTPPSGCEYDGTIYPFGNFKRGPCEDCVCEENGEAECYLRPCPRPMCDNPVREGDECCGTCPEPTTPGPPPGCEYQGKFYPVGDFKAGPCEDCICNEDGEAACYYRSCPRPMCDNPNFDTEPCCGTCPEPTYPTPSPPTTTLPPPPDGCVYDGVHYEFGNFKRGPCEDCVCEENGEAECYRRPCPRPMCDNPVREGDECCGTCPEPTTPGPPPGCEYQGKFYPVGDFKVGPCEDCTCRENGEATCYIKPCPRPACDNPSFDTDPCCGTCPKPTTPGPPPGCEYEGKFYPVGKFKPDPCKFCTCEESGVSSCAMPKCPRLACDKPVRKPGECCFSCPDGATCEYGGKTYKQGSFQPDPCTRCTCSASGKAECLMMACMMPRCENGAKPISVPGECCQRCPDLEPFTVCEYNGKKYPVGKFKPSRCESCECMKDGKAECHEFACLPAMCANPVQKEDECCPSCPNGAECTYQGKTYKQGKFRPHPCSDCECNAMGMPICMMMACAMPDCDESTWVRKPDECCPRCPENEQVTCEYGGKHYKLGTFRPDPCSHCTCKEDGKALCAVMSCAFPYCGGLKPITKPGKCCPQCPEPGPAPGGCPAHDGTIVPRGESQILRDGSRCECSDTLPLAITCVGPPLVFPAPETTPPSTPPSEPEPSSSSPAPEPVTPSAAQLTRRQRRRQRRIILRKQARKEAKQAARKAERKAARIAARAAAKADNE